MSAPFLFRFSSGSEYVMARSPQIRWKKCGVCGQPTHYEVPDHVELRIRSQARRWPDVLNTAGMDMPLTVAERAVSAFQEFKVGGVEWIPCVMEEIDSRRLKKVPSPKYFVGRIFGRVALTTESFDAEPDRCSACGFFLRGPKFVRAIPETESWDGSGICEAANRQFGLSFCTFKVIEAARKHQLTNCRFLPMDVPATADVTKLFPLEEPPFDVDYLGAEWPPKRWYPRGYTPHPNNLKA